MCESQLDAIVSPNPKEKENGAGPAISIKSEKKKKKRATLAVPCVWTCGTSINSCHPPVEREVKNLQKNQIITQKKKKNTFPTEKKQKKTVRNV